MLLKALLFLSILSVSVLSHASRTQLLLSHRVPQILPSSKSPNFETWMEYEYLRVIEKLFKIRRYHWMFDHAISSSDDRKHPSANQTLSMRRNQRRIFVLNMTNRASHSMS